MQSPLRGIRVLDLTRVLSGPYATQQLIDLGADVLKIERPGGGDDTRRFGPPFVAGESTYFMSVNRGKKSVVIDLKSPKGRELIRGLAGRADVVIENFRPGTATRLGLGHKDLRALTPRLITCSISGYGEGGDPDYEGLPGYDAVIQGVSGLMALTGHPSGPSTKVGVAVSDMVAGLFATQGILAALVERGQTGQGRHIDISMQDAMCTLLTYQAGIYFATGEDPPRMGNAHPSICPYETVETKDGPYTLAIGNNQQFDRLAHVLNLPWLKDDERFRTNRDRVHNRAVLMAMIAPKMREKTRKEWDRCFRENAIPGGPVLTVSQALSHPQVKARSSILTHAHPAAGPIHTVASPVRFDGWPPLDVDPPPRFGQHTREVLKHDLGLSNEQVDTLAKEKVIELETPENRSEP